MLFGCDEVAQAGRKCGGRPACVARLLIWSGKETNLLVSNNLGELLLTENQSVPIPFF